MRIPDLGVDGGIDTSPTSPPRPRRVRGDVGFTLTETMLAIVLMGTVIMVILSGIIGVIRVSSTSDNAARVEAMLTSAADRLAGWTYLSCPAANDQGYDAVVGAASDDVDWYHDDAVSIVLIEYWDPTTGAPGPNGDPLPADGRWELSNDLEFTTGGCGEDVNFTTSRTLQRVTIEARSPDDSIVRQLQVVKSNVGDRIESTP